MTDEIDEDQIEADRRYISSYVMLYANPELVKNIKQLIDDERDIEEGL